MNPLPPQYGETMSCPFTGLAIPKTTAGNLAWRKQLLAYGKSSSVWRTKLRSAASSSPIFWLNAFGWTFLQKKIASDGHEAAVYGELSHVPFITWKIQDEALVNLTKAVDGGKDALIQKTRDMGASWLIVSLFQWYWQFRPSTTFLELSRKQSLVDRRGDMDSLFEKHRYLLKWQPEWLRPRRIVDNLLHLENQDNGSTIEGESTNENAGQASRKTAILLDEFARVPNGEEIDLATADTTSCRIFNSTPQGPNTQFSRIYRGISGGSRSGVLITLPWFRHPDKGAGATVVKDDQGKERYTSPWYEDQIKRRSKRNIAQNIDMEHGRSGDMFFDPDEIETHRRLYQSDPLAIGNIRFDEDLNEEQRIALIKARLDKALTWTEIGSRRPWRLWMPLINGRPNQETRYVFGVDISNGSGASNSVISVLDHTSRIIVAKFWDAFTSPEDLATTVAMAGIWFGGKKLPYVTFEKNGPGVIFGRKLLKLGYPSIYYQKVDSTKVEQKTTRWGWQSSSTRKELMLGQYRDGLKTGAVINPCREALDEAGEYVYDDNGKIEPGSMGVEEGGGGALHGDHVIADGLTLLGDADLPKVEPPTPAHIPQGTYADRRRVAKKKQDDRSAWSR